MKAPLEETIQVRKPHVCIHYWVTPYAIRSNSLNQVTVMGMGRTHVIAEHWKLTHKIMSSRLALGHIRKPSCELWCPPIPPLGKQRQGGACPCLRPTITDRKSVV